MLRGAWETRGRAYIFKHGAMDSLVFKKLLKAKVGFFS
jgi:hypothetical protein